MEKPRARGKPLCGLPDECCRLLRAVSGQCRLSTRIGRVGCATPASGRGAYASVAVEDGRGGRAEEEWSRRRRRCGRTVKSTLPAVVMAASILAARSPGGEAASAGYLHTCAVLSNDTVKVGLADNDPGVLCRVSRRASVVEMFDLGHGSRPSVRDLWRM